MLNRERNYPLHNANCIQAGAMTIRRALPIIVMLAANVAAPFVWAFAYGFILIILTGFPDACDLDGCGPKSPWWEDALVYLGYFIPLLLLMYLGNMFAIRRWVSPRASDRTTA